MKPFFSYVSHTCVDNPRASCPTCGPVYAVEVEAAHSDDNLKCECCGSSSGELFKYRLSTGDIRVLHAKCFDDLAGH